MFLSIQINDFYLNGTNTFIPQSLIWIKNMENKSVISWRSRLRMTQKQQIFGIIPHNKAQSQSRYRHTECHNDYNHFQQNQLHFQPFFSLQPASYSKNQIQNRQTRLLFNWFPTVFLTTESSFRIASETQRTFFLILLFFFTEERFHSSVQHKDLGFRQSIQKEVLQGLKITITYAVPKEVFSGIC